MFHVIAIRKEKLLTRHLERSRKISTIACLQAIVFLKEIKKMISICIFDTLTFAKAKV